MRVRSITLLLALGSLAVGCGGSSGGMGSSAGQPTPADTGYQTPPGSYQAPPASTTDSSTSQQASGSFDAPPGQYEAPPGSTGSGGGSGSSGGDLTVVCTRLCNIATNLNCTDLEPGESGTDCTQACAQEFGSIPCSNEVGDALGCLLDSSSFDCETISELASGDSSGSSEIDQTLASNCQTQAAALAQCEGPSTQPQPQPQPKPGQSGGGTCQTADYCANCTSTCDICRCSAQLSGSDAAECDSLCTN